MLEGIRSTNLFVLFSKWPALCLNQLMSKPATSGHLHIPYNVILQNKKITSLKYQIYEIMHQLIETLKRHLDGIKKSEGFTVNQSSLA